MFSDIVGYTALMAEDESRGLRVRERHRQVVDPLAEQHHGERVDENGDELVLSFPSALDAVRCALAIQAEASEDPDLRLRIGIHLGDVVFEGGRIYGDGVNLASRIRALADPGGICISEEVHHSVQNQPAIQTRSLGRHELKNVSRPVAVYAVGGEATSATRAALAAWTQGRSLLFGLAAAAIVVTALGTWLWRGPSSSGRTVETLAVLPQDNLSGDPAEDYFVDGMTEALIADLAQLRALRVISRTSVMRYKGTEQPLPEIARALGADAL